MGMFVRFEDITGYDAGFRKTGFLFLHPEDHIRQLQVSAQRLNHMGTRVWLLDRTDLANQFPEIHLDQIAVGAWEEDAGYADPVSTTSGLFHKAQQLGLEASLYVSVTAINARYGGGAVITTDKGERCECERLLLAAGPWTRPLASHVGVDLPLTVERHFVGTFGWGNAKPLKYIHADLVGGYYMKPEGSELFLIGPLTPEAEADPDEFDQNIRGSEIDEMTSALIRRVPALAESDSRGGWASLYDVSPDWQPVIGEIAEGIFVDAGTSGHGFKLALALGSHIAGMVIGRPDPGLQQFHPSRFDRGLPLQAGYGTARILG